MSFEVKFQQSPEFVVGFTPTPGFEVGFVPDQGFAVDFGEVQTIVAEDVERYRGDYEVTPTADGLTLPTEKKLMTNNLEVNPIPFYQVGNNSGGQTIYIGGADEIITS